MKNIVLCLQFKGTRYCGWQRQVQENTVQGVMERTIDAVIQEKVKLVGCSRTDSGVHACEFVCNFSANTELNLERLVAALNNKLQIANEDISVLNSRYVDKSFNSRFSAKSKTYLYKIWNSSAKNPFLNDLAYTIPRKLAINSMLQTLDSFVGKHDFAGFVSSKNTTKTTIREINSLTMKYKAPLLEIEINAKCYMYNMVRIIVGTLLAVGMNHIMASDIPGIILSGKRECAGPTAPSHGLYLKNVIY